MTNRRARRPSGRRGGAGAPSSASWGSAAGWTAPAAPAAPVASRNARGTASRARRCQSSVFWKAKKKTLPSIDTRRLSSRSERNESHDDDVRVRTETPGRRARASSREARLEARTSVRRFGRRDALGARARRGHSTRSASQSSRRSPEVSREGAFVPSRRSRRGSWSRRGCRTCARRARAWAGARRRGSWWRRGTCWGEDVGGCRGRAGARVNWRHHR